MTTITALAQQITTFLNDNEFSQVDVVNPGKNIMIRRSGSNFQYWVGKGAINDCSIADIDTIIRPALTVYESHDMMSEVELNYHS